MTLRMATLRLLLCAIFITLCYGEQQFRLGSFHIVVGNSSSSSLLRVMHCTPIDCNRLVLSSLHGGAPFLGVREGDVLVTMMQGNSRVRTKELVATEYQSVDELATDQDSLVLRGTLTGKLSGTYDYTFTLAQVSNAAADSNTLQASVSIAHNTSSDAQVKTGLPHVYSNAMETILTWASDANASFYGFGEQYSILDLAGRVVPVITSEQGVGRGVQPLTDYLNKANNGGGDWSTTYCPMPWYLYAGGSEDAPAYYGLFLDGTGYSQFELDQPGKATIAIPDLGAPQDENLETSFHIVSAGGPKGIITELTKSTGRLDPLPQWVDEGVVVGLEGGTNAVKEAVRVLDGAGVPVAGVWMQDWTGIRNDSFGQRLWWNWELDEHQYPDWNQLVGDLMQRRVRVLTYINPYLANNVSIGKSHYHRNLFKEAAALGYLIKNSSGLPYIQASGTEFFQFGTVDFTNPSAAAWYQDVIRCNMLGDQGGCPNGTAARHVAGVGGFMADFGEYVPFDAVLHTGQGSMVHNEYPVLWSATVKAAIAQAGSTPAGVPQSLEVVPWLRSGGLRTPGNMAGLAWAGDQLVSWDGDDGIATVLAAHMSLGMSGVSMSHSDIGGYTMLDAVVNETQDHHTKKISLKYLRSKELLMRWMELSAFADAIFRTHPGNLPSKSAQWNTDNQTLAHLAAFAGAFKAMSGYRRSLMEEAKSVGWPLVRHTFLEYPDDPNTRKLQRQFMLGSEVIVAPVLHPNTTTVEVYLPQGSGTWTHAWSGTRYAGGHTVLVKAPLGEPGLFYKTPSAVTMCTTNMDCPGIGNYCMKDPTKNAPFTCHHKVTSPVTTGQEAIMAAVKAVRSVREHSTGK